MFVTVVEFGRKVSNSRGSWNFRVSPVLSSINRRIFFTEAHKIAVMPRIQVAKYKLVVEFKDANECSR